MLMRSTTDADIERVAACVVDEPIGRIGAERFLAESAERLYRPEWTWIGEEEGRVVARALWWGPADAAHPVALDCLWVDASVAERATVGAELIARGMSAFMEHGAPRVPVYNVDLARGWRPDAARSAAIAWRRAAALAAGLTDEVERLQFEWTPDLGVPEPSSRLVFAQADDAAFLAVFRRIAEGSLDASTRRGVAAHGAEDAARREMDFYLDSPGERDWWRIAHTRDGAVAGLALPSATPYGRNVGYLGVVPEFRGRGLVGDLLDEITRIHAAADAPRISATTDVSNAPMAAAFERAGYRNTRVRMLFSSPAT